ncbi:MAG TPA: hypothetical protein VN688_32540, partial [Gemmataceae bacterium]|nr:hypothetical protein [Gemmataceae bacterium]
PSESSVDLGSQPEIAALSPSGEGLEAVVVEDSGIDLAGISELTASPPNDSNLVLESLLASDSGTRPAEEPAALAEEEVVAEASDEEAALAAVDEPVVSEAEVDELLAGLEEPAANAADLAAMAEEEAVASDVAEGDEAVAEAEAEVAAETEAEAEEEKPSKPVKQRSRVPALVGGTFLGLLLGAGGLIGARVGGVDVPALMGLGEQKKPAGPVVPQAKAPAFKEWAAHVSNGDWDAAKAGIDQIQGNNPDELAVRGSYHLGEYLQAAKAKIDPQDPKLQVAIADLKKAAEANNLDAIYDLGLINELANKWNEARAEYTKGVNAAGDKPNQKQRFQSALDRVELKASDKAPGAAFAPLPQRVEDRVALLALLLIGLQQPPVPAPAPPVGQPQEAGEAGFDFWAAAKEARKGDFDKAIRAIDKARTAHDQRRFSRLRKAQNPLSDPTEDIFLRCCDELKQYWLLESHLRERNYLTDKNTAQDALQDLLKKADASTETLKGVADKFIKEKIITRPEEVAKGADRLIADKKDAEAKVDDLTTKLEKTTKEATDLAGKLKTAEATIKDRDTKLKAAADQELKLKAANDDLGTTLKKITDELAAAKLLDPKGKPNVGEAVRKVVDLAKVKDPQGLIRTQRNELTQMAASLKQRWRPEEMMPLWLVLLEQNRTRAELATKAAIDVERVEADPAATAGQKGQAQIVLGLALRNTEKFDEAKTVLQSARKAVDKAEWLTVAEAAFREVSNPAAYYAGQAQKLYDRGQMNAALAVLTRAMQALPAKDQARLLAQRSLIELDAARSKTSGRIPPSDPLLIAAKKDAAEAVKAGLAEGHYAAGRIAEELGQWDAAIQSYRQALAVHKVLDAEGSRYRIALARVLLQPHQARQGPPAPAENKVGWRDPAPYPARHREDMKQFLLLVTLGLQAPGLPDEEPGLQEAEQIADEILKAPANTVPFNVRAQALAIKGRWTPALQTYIEGIRPLLPREYGNGLLYLIVNHPRLKRPDSLRIPNPAEAEKHFAAGLNFYFDRDYANAEREFLLTVENDAQDARYFYFLGLSRLLQNRRRDAYADFDEGAMLERLNRPAPAAVSESLERIQGPTRRIVNEIRNRPEILPERR